MPTASWDSRGRAGDVGGEDDVVEAVEGRSLERLLAEDVEGGTGNVAGLECGGESSVVNQFTAGAVDDADVGLHFGEGGGVDDALGLGGEADVEREIVRGRDEFVEVNEADAVFAGDGSGDEGIVADEFHAEGAGAAGDLEADPAEAEDAEGLGFEFAALEGFFSPSGRRAWRRWLWEAGGRGRA